MKAEAMLAEAIRARKPRGKSEPTAEWRLQCSCAKIAREVARLDKKFRFEFINLEGKRDPKRAAILKMMGSEPGTLECRVYYQHGARLKMGVGDCKGENGRATDAQKAWLDYFNDGQVLGMLIYSTDDYWKLVDWVRTP